MSTLKSLGRWSAALLTIWVANIATVQAWTSGPETGSGPERARLLWSPTLDVNPPNEHGYLFSLALNDALVALQGASELPMDISSILEGTHQLQVYTLAANSVETFSTVAPESFSGAETVRKVERPYDVSGFAALPDHSYSLWDWSKGNETCPPGTRLPGDNTDDAVDCHKTSTHLGPLNSHHFGSQAQAMFSHYHRLAVQRGESCRQMFISLDGRGTFSQQLVAACFREAVLIEAVGQHFLQDDWAVGHMWQRWGAPDLRRFEGTDATNKRQRAFVVALIAGMIHGAEAVLPLARDAMSGGDDPDVGYKTANGDSHQGIGDLHADELLMAAEYAGQGSELLDCSKSAIVEVLAGAGTGSRNPLGSECLGHWNRNLSILKGFGLNNGDARIGFLDDVIEGIPLVAVITIKLPADEGLPPLSPADSEQLRLELIAMSWRTALLAALQKDGTELAANGLTPTDGLLGIKDNPQYLSFPSSSPGASPVNAFPPAPFADPVLPWPDTAGNPPTLEKTGEAALALARTFHRAHAKDWCANDEASPTKLKAEVDRLRPIGTDSNGKTARLACDVCVEFMSRHARLNGEPSICDALGVGGWSQDVTIAPGSVMLGDPLKYAGAQMCGCAVTGVEITLDGSQVVTVEGLAPPVVPSQFTVSGSPLESCGGEQGGPVYSAIVSSECQADGHPCIWSDGAVPGDASLHPANIVSGVAQLFGTAANRRPCSTFVAVKNAVDPDLEEVWVNATERRVQFSGGFTTDREYQLRYYNGAPDGDPPARCEAGSVVVGFGGFFPSQFFSCEHELIFGPTSQAGAGAAN